MTKKQKRRDNQHQKIERDDKLVLEGVVLDALPSTLFMVELTNGLQVLTTLSGKLRQNRIRILPGDFVTIEVSPYDTSRGRITWRRGRNG